jgi:undecaprenyl phosphate N,N'-diacetylbacillosamine 1-phosphate transferase
LDKLSALVILLASSPVWLGAWLMLAIANQGSAWFLQPRPGLHGQRFRVIKFKTMTDATDAQGVLLPDGERLTRIGRWVRKTSIDELPQLFNVLKGEMSLVGPRPLLEEYLPLYSPDQQRRHEVKPGITGWAQVHGRNTVPWPERLAMDVWYVDHQSFWLDIKILFLTVVKVFQAEGISSGTSVTMEKFKGTEGN